jgi:hypothetical protein
MWCVCDDTHDSCDVIIWYLASHKQPIWDILMWRMSKLGTAHDIAPSRHWQKQMLQIPCLQLARWNWFSQQANMPGHRAYAGTHAPQSYHVISLTCTLWIINEVTLCQLRWPFTQNQKSWFIYVFSKTNIYFSHQGTTEVSHVRDLSLCQLRFNAESLPIGPLQCRLWCVLTT